MRRPSYWLALGVVVCADVATKYLAHTRLIPHHVSREIWGDTARLTLVYNPGAAFGLHLGSWSREIFMALTALALIVLGRLYLATARRDWSRALAIGLVSGGALGNLINRVWSERGVVDFIDVGIRGHRWPTFNIADIGVTSGALLLASSLWREDRGGDNEDTTDPRSVGGTFAGADGTGSRV